MPVPRRDAFIARGAAGAERDAGLRARAGVGRRAGRNGCARAHAGASARRGAARAAGQFRRRRGWWRGWSSWRSCSRALAGCVADGDAPRWVEAFAPARGEGVAAVQTARGLLLHRARVDDGPRRRATRSSRRPNGTSIRRARSRAGSTGMRRRRRGDAARGTRGSSCRRSIPASPAASRSAMHEMALAEGMLADRRGHGAQERRDARRVGAASRSARSSHVEPEALRFCFDAVTRGGLADGARLEIVTTPGLAWCMPCGDARAARAAGRRVPALRQLPAPGRRGRGDAGEGNRDRVSAGCTTRSPARQEKSDVHDLRMRTR